MQGLELTAIAKVLNDQEELVSEELVSEEFSWHKYFRMFIISSSFYRSFSLKWITPKLEKWCKRVVHIRQPFPRLALLILDLQMKDFGLDS